MSSLHVVGQGVVDTLRKPPKVVATVTSLTLTVRTIGFGCRQFQQSRCILQTGNELVGIERVEVSVDAKTVDVAYADDVSLDSIIEAIEEQGYDVASS